MDRKAIIWWAFVWGGLFLFFRSFGLFVFLQHEEVQLFLPEWAWVKRILVVPGGFCTVAAQSLVQFYPVLWLALFINASFVCAVGVVSYLLLQRIVPRAYNLPLALVPAIALASVHLNPNYVLDGTVGILLALLFLYLFLSLGSARLQMLFCLAGSVAVFFLIGQFVVLFGVLLVAVFLFCKKKGWLYPAVLLLAGSVLSYAGFRMGLYVPLADGIYSERYQMSQLQPDSFVYYIWIRFSVLLLVLFLAAWLLGFIRAGRWSGRFLAVGVSVVALAFGFVCRPGAAERRGQVAAQLSYLSQNGRWDDIVRLHEGKKINYYIDLNYLNMALARRGELADKMFRYNQKGPQSLLLEWDRTYFSSALLSDIHFMVGDVSVSESYAMDALTLVKRGGSPRMLKRLAEINVAKGDFGVARKYAGILSRMPLYERWAENCKKEMQEKGRLSAMPAKGESGDNLLCLMSIDSLWMAHLQGPEPNKIAFDYLGCSYLLSKELDKFESFLACAGSVQAASAALPVHFQEAVLLLSLEKPRVLGKYPVSPDVARRFKGFLSHARAAGGNGGLLSLKQEYGDTFWFYFYFKKL